MTLARPASPPRPWPSDRCDHRGLWGRWKLHHEQLERREPDCQPGKYHHDARGLAELHDLRPIGHLHGNDRRGAPGAGTPTGSVEFFDGTTPIGTTPLSGSTAAVSTAALSAGTHSITAQYRGDGNFSSSTSSPATVPFRMASTTTKLSSSASTLVFGQSVTFSATIGVVARRGRTHGLRHLQGRPTTLGTGALNSTNQATFATTTLAVGSHTITAVYGGDPNFSGSTSVALAQTVSKDGSTAAITSSASPSVLNQSVSFTVTVSAAAPGSGTPTGTVQFRIDGSKFGSAVALAGGSATSTSISTLKLGNHTITASYSGDGNFTASTAPSFTQVVNKDNTTTSLVVTVNPSVYGQSISFTARVAAVAPGTGTPTGTVTFFDGSTTLSTVTLTAGAATYTTTKLVTGQHAITAFYNGNSTFAISTSAALTQTVNQDHTSTVVTASADPSVYGQSVTFTATVSAAVAGQRHADWLGHVHGRLDGVGLSDTQWWQGQIQDDLAGCRLAGDHRGLWRRWQLQHQHVSRPDPDGPAGRDDNKRDLVL